MADMDFTDLITVFYLWRAKKRRRRRRPWVHQTLQGQEQFGDYHHLIQELCLDDGRFQRYFSLSRTQFEDLLSRVGRQIGLQDTNYRRCIPAAERLSICLRKKLEYPERTHACTRRTCKVLAEKLQARMRTQDNLASRQNWNIETRVFTLT
ncbi:hypothetical protein CHARACLAT_011754 [Characodon lateralis]|uniref:Uncharacterized protein n=1 Tax=Characodon lateralis TaxID=208331 RepID=A0ABU7EL10_9TELE|nr:hypothetical protein [Characodon lateralis]